MPMQDPPEDADEIRLTLPAVAGYARVVRLAICGLASRNGFAYEEVEDLRIATGELFGVLVEPESTDDHLVFTCRLRTDGLELEAQRAQPSALAEVTDLTRQILAAVADRVEIDQPGGTLRIVKQIDARR